jgi:cation-transporting P-type ATPase 13A2
MILWFWDGYQKYACCILVISLWGIYENLSETITNMRSIRKMAHYVCPIEILRDGNIHKSISDAIVPGDVIVVPSNCIMPCDLLLLSGQCIVNESMLTGESVPVIKNAIMPIKEVFDPKDDKASKHILFSGTKVIQARQIAGQPAYALVIRTGFTTTKGSLVRDILYPRDTKFKFYRDSLVFVGAMALIAIFGFIGTVPRLIELGTSTEKLVDKSLDLITVTVPPALPATLTVGVSFAISRLRKSQIYCISPPRVNVSGMLKIMVFDKTGTLTEDGLQILGIRGCTGNFNDGFDTLFSDFFENINGLLNNIKNAAREARVNLLQEAMACCHAITYIDKDLIGDPLEINMFESTGWNLEEP